jgi:hypothetical protein
VTAALGVMVAGSGAACTTTTEPTAPAVRQYATVEGVGLDASISPSTLSVGAGDSAIVELTLTNPTGSEITVRLARDSGGLAAVADYAAFVVAPGATVPLTPAVAGQPAGYIYAGTAVATVPIPGRSSIVQALGVLHVGSAMPRGTTFVLHILAPGQYAIHVCAVQPGPVESCAPAQTLTVTP